MRQTIVVILLLIVVWGGVGCQTAQPLPECADELGCVTIGLNEPLKIGVLQALSGSVVSIGQAQLQTIELALSERDNQLLGHPIELIVEDSLCSPEGGANAALKVIADADVVAIIGPSCSGSAAEVAGLVLDAGLTMISGTATGPALTSADGNWQPGFFRAVYNAGQQAEAAAFFGLNELGLMLATTVHDRDLYTVSVVNTFEEKFKALGGEIVLSSVINRGDTDFRPVLVAQARTEATLLFAPLIEPEGDYLVQQIKDVPELADRQLGQELVVIGASGLLADTFIEAVQEDGVGMYFVGPASPQGEGLDALTARYEAAYGEPPPATFYGYTYDAANLLLDTIEAIAVQGRDGELQIGRQALRDAMYGTRGFEGVTGTLSCSGFGDCGVGEFNIMRLDDPAKGIDGLRENILYTYRPSVE